MFFFQRQVEYEEILMQTISLFCKATKDIFEVIPEKESQGYLQRTITIFIQGFIYMGEVLKIPPKFIEHLESDEQIYSTLRSHYLSLILKKLWEELSQIADEEDWSTFFASGVHVTQFPKKCQTSIQSHFHKFFEIVSSQNDVIYIYIFGKSLPQFY